MLTVGINENVVLTGAAVNDKGVLSITLDHAENVGKEKSNVFDAMQTAGVTEDAKGFPLNIFPFKFPDGPKNETKTIDEKVQMVSDDMLKTKNQLDQLLQQYKVLDDIKWDVYYGTGIDGKNYRERFQDNDALAKVFANLAKQFIEMSTPFWSKPEFKLRVKLIRQSKDKHFATIPGRFLNDNPWVELMDIPAAQSKVKFTPWEKNNGYDNGAPVQRSATDLPPGEAVSSDNGTPVASVFGAR